jgi:neutral ceramidase
MNAGAAIVDITPPLGTSLAGYFHDRRASGVHDPLLAKALAIEADGRAFGIIACDLIALPDDAVRAIRAGAAAGCDLRAQDVMVACTHTHTGPPTINVFQTRADRGAVDHAVQGATQALLDSRSACQPATLRVARGELRGFTFNRRYRLADGGAVSFPGPRPDIVGPAGPVDPEVIVLSFAAASAAPIAVIVNFALHLDTVGGDVISADYPSFMSALIRDGLGPQTVPIFLNGACGDINHLDYSSPQHPGQGFERAQAIGEALGRTALAILPDAEPMALHVEAGSETVRLRTRALSREVVARAHETVASAPTLGSLDREQVWAYETVRVSELAPTVEAEIQALRLGDCALVGIPCEVFTELGMEIKRRSPLAATAVVELANGYHGYLPTRRAYDEGGYEATPARSSKLAPGSGEDVVEAAVGLLRSLPAP